MSGEGGGGRQRALEEKILFSFGGRAGRITASIFPSRLGGANGVSCVARLGKIATRPDHTTWRRTALATFGKAEFSLTDKR